MPTLNLKLDELTNTRLNELVIALTIADPSHRSNRSHAARKAIIELHNSIVPVLPRTVVTDLREDR